MSLSDPLRGREEKLFFLSQLSEEFKNTALALVLNIGNAADDGYALFPGACVRPIADQTIDDGGYGDCEDEPEETEKPAENDNGYHYPCA